MDVREFFVEKGFDLARLPQSVIIDSGGRESREKAAKLLASAVQCRGSDKPCGECAACRKVGSDSHPDVSTVSVAKGKKLVSVAQVREVRTAAYVRPHEGEARVFIFPDADCMTDEAQNALLKVMEEPPAGLLFVFCLPHAGALLPTVRSRSVTVSLPFEGEEVSGAAAEKRRAAVSAFAKAAVSGSEADLIASTVPLDRDRKLMLEVFSLFRVVLRDAVAVRGSAVLVSGCGEEAAMLSSAVSKAKLIRMDAATAAACAALERNGKESVVSSRLCGEIKNILSE